MNAPTDRPPEKTIGQIVVAQFRRNKTAVFGFWVVVGLFLLAITAPIWATSSPFFIRYPDGSTRYPWFRDLFDRNIWSSGVDIFFNIALLLLVPAAVAIKFARGHRKRVVLISIATLLYFFFSAVGPKVVVESAVGKVLFFPQQFLRYSNDPELTDYLSTERKAASSVVVAELNIIAAEKNLVRKRADRDAAQASSNEAVRKAADEELAEAERKLQRWQEELPRAKAVLADPKQRHQIWLPPIGYHHDDGNLDRSMESPSIRGGWGYCHILGTDTLGRDVLVRLLYGTRISLTIGFIAVAIYCTIGTIVGALMGFFGGWVDMLGMRLVEIMMCFPRLAFILVIVGVTNSRSIFMIMVAIGILGWAGVARLIRGQFFAERNLDYVAAARSLGVPTRAIVFKHVLPNAIHPMFISATFGVAAAILTESGLAFLGLGDPNVPSWGQMLLKGRETMKDWLIFGPGIAIFVTVTSLNLVGEGLRDALDPKLRQ